MERDWVYYTAPGGGRPVEKEIARAGLNEYEAGRLNELMDDVRDGEARAGVHFKHLRDGVREIRLSGNRRIFRLLYAEVDAGLVVLALHFIAKKKQSDQDAIKVAADRLTEWKRRT